ncbi:hypothetical protein Ddc_02026 [Ditylenchus destructor]|nr:hypothetical protein Ddc_02026 [Ditylenchus destructor]
MTGYCAPPDPMAVASRREESRTHPSTSNPERRTQFNNITNFTTGCAIIITTNASTVCPFCDHCRPNPLIVVYQIINEWLWG